MTASSSPDTTPAEPAGTDTASGRFPTPWEVATLPTTLLAAAGTLSAVGSGIEVLRAALSTGKSALVNAKDLPGGIGTVPFEASVGIVPFQVGAAPDLPPYPDTRQLRLAWHVLSQFADVLRAAVEKWTSPRVGLILGTSTGGILSTESALIEKDASGKLPSTYSCQYGHNMDAAARYLAESFGLRGPVYAVSAACASGAKALASARRWIELGVCDAVVAGGVDSICRMTLHGFHSLGVLSQKRCQPFDDSEPGMNVAEGATLFLLERATGPLNSSDVALVGVGESSDAYHMSAPDPTGRSQARAMVRSLADAKLEPNQVSYINAHGTGTKANDGAEASCLSSVAPGIPANSTKGILGHQLGAAGATEALIAVEALRGAPIADFGATNSGAFPLQLKSGGAAMSNSFAFGGANISLSFATSEHVRQRRRAVPPALCAAIAAWAHCDEQQESDEEWGRELFAPRARARASELTRLGAHLIMRLGLSREELAEVPIVVGSALGQIRTTRRLIELFLENDSSPLAFQSSVHNAVAGALSLALSNKKPSSSVAGGSDTSFCTLLEALSYLWTEPEDNRIVVLCLEEHPPDDLGLVPYRRGGAAFLLDRDQRECPFEIALVGKAQLPSDFVFSSGGPSENGQLSPEAIVLAKQLESWAADDAEERGKSPSSNHIGIASSHSDYAMWVTHRKP